MKKLFALVLAGIMVISLAACGQSKNENETSGKADSVEEVASGGWSRAESPVVPDEVKSLLEKAAEGMLGADYTPVAYIGSQVVSGTNHAVLCKIAPAVPDASATYSIVILYEDLEGNVEITDVLDSEAEAPADSDEGVSGGWEDAESPVMTEEAKAALEKATEEMLGADYTPIALLGTQVVAGTNYSILCEITATSPDAEPSYSVVVVYEDLEGNAEITDSYDFATNE